MVYIVNSRKLKRQLTFFIDGKEGYIFVDLNNKPGLLGQQICKGGYLIGSTLRANETNFIKICKQWLKQYYKNNL